MRVERAHVIRDGNHRFALLVEESLGPSAARSRCSFARPSEKRRAYSGLKEHERRE